MDHDGRCGSCGGKTLRELYDYCGMKTTDTYTRTSYFIQHPSTEGHGSLGKLVSKVRAKSIRS